MNREWPNREESQKQGTQEQKLQGHNTQMIQKLQGKTNGETQAAIRQMAAGLEPDPHKKNHSLTCIQEAIEAKKIHNVPSSGQLFGIQLQYIPPLFWMIQGGLLLLLLLFLYKFTGQRTELTDYLWWGSVIAAWMGVLSQGLLGKHFSHGMAELEQSCYINLSQMWAIRMILTTGVDIVILTVFSGGIALRTETFVGRIAVYLLTPFVLSNICCLSAVSVLRGSREKYALAVLAVVTALLAVSPSVFPEMYKAAWLWVWFCMLLLETVIFAGQIRRCYNRMVRGEMICWN